MVFSVEIVIADQIPADCCADARCSSASPISICRSRPWPTVTHTVCHCEGAHNNCRAGRSAGQSAATTLLDSFRATLPASLAEWSRRPLFGRDPKLHLDRHGPSKRISCRTASYISWGSAWANKVIPPVCRLVRRPL